MYREYLGRAIYEELLLKLILICEKFIDTFNFELEGYEMNILHSLLQY